MDSDPNLWAEIDEQGRLVLPKEVSESYGVKSGTRVRIEKRQRNILQKKRLRENRAVRNRGDRRAGGARAGHPKTGGRIHFSLVKYI